MVQFCAVKARCLTVDLTSLPSPGVGGGGHRPRGNHRGGAVETQKLWWFSSVHC